MQTQGFNPVLQFKVAALLRVKRIMPVVGHDDKLYINPDLKIGDIFAITADGTMLQPREGWDTMFEDSTRCPSILFRDYWRACSCNVIEPSEAPYFHCIQASVYTLIGGKMPAKSLITPEPA